MGNEGKIRVRLEPELEEEVWHLPPHRRRALARRFYRWAKQLWVSADIIEADQSPRPKRGLKPIPARKRAWN